MNFLPVCEPTLNGKEVEYVLDAVSSGWISSAGKYIEKFESEFSFFSGAKHAIAVTNGSCALHVALVGMGIGPGDEVIVPSFTMIASAFAVMQTGAVPIFCEIDERTWNIDVNSIEERITTRTKAIMPVHIFGSPCDLLEIEKIAKKHNLKIIQDSAESHGAKVGGNKIDEYGDASAYSFFANKNLTTGEGGMVTTNSDTLNEKIRKLKNLSFDPIDRNYIHDQLGFNYRMSNLHAAIGLAQVERGNELINLRIQNAKIYRSLLSETPGIELQAIPDWAESVHWMNAIVINPAIKIPIQKIMGRLKEKGIDSRRLFQGMHRQPAFKEILSNYGSEDFKHTDYLSDNGLYLPSSSHLTRGEIERVVSELDRIIN